MLYQSIYLHHRFQLVLILPKVVLVIFENPIHKFRQSDDVLFDDLRLLLFPFLVAAGRVTYSTCGPSNLEKFQEYNII